MRRMNCVPKRAASGARGRSITSTMHLRPACPKAASMSGAMRSAASRNRSSAARAPPGGVRFLGKITKAGHRPGAADRVRDGGAGRKTLQPEPPHDVVAEGGFAAEQMRAARDVERQSIRRIEPDQRGVTIAPVGNGG